MKQKITKINKKNSCDWRNWLNNKDVEASLKHQINKMTPEQKEANFSKDLLAFGTAGIRAIMGPGTQLLNKFTYIQMAVGFAKYLLSVSDKPSAVIGHDNRINSDVFAMECAKVLQTYGIQVILFENNKLMPTPIVSYAVKRLKATGGINITASHNPKEYNGFKAYNDSGSQILPAEGNVIIRNMPQACEILNIKMPKNRKRLSIKYIDNAKFIEEYFIDLKNNVVINKKFIAQKKQVLIVFTGHHGTTCELMPQWLKMLGFTKVYSVPTQSSIDTTFKGSPISNPEDSKSFAQAIKYADKVKANIVFGCDPDGDRMAIGFRKPHKWVFMNGNEMGIIYIYYCLKHINYVRNPYILTSHVSTNYINAIAADFKAEVIRTKTGFKWMCNLIDQKEKKGSMVVAFEEAIGALNCTINRDKDAFGAIAMALEIYYAISKQYIDLHEYIRTQIFGEYGDHVCTTNSYSIISDNWKKDSKDITKIVLGLKQKTLYNYKINKVLFNKQGDCVEWQLDNNSWIKFRISGTEQKFKAYFCLNNMTMGSLKKTYKKINKFIEKELLKDYKFK